VKKNQIRVNPFYILMTVLILLLLTVYLFIRGSMQAKINGAPPVISFAEDLIEVSVTDGTEALLDGVAATDNRGGDVTDSIIIESLSPLLDGNVRIVTYAAFDAENHVTRAQRRIRYTDYTPIRFSLRAPLCGSYNNWDIESLLAPLSADDCIDGSLSDSIVVTRRTWDSQQGDVQILTAYVQVTNSGGEVASLALPIVLRMDDARPRSQGASIALKSYLVYHPADTVFDPTDYLASVTAGEQTLDASAVTIDSRVDITTPGVYRVIYSYVSDRPQVYAETELIVVVE